MRRRREECRSLTLILRRLGVMFRLRSSLRDWHICSNAKGAMLALTAHDSDFCKMSG
jgi:hypothetical protein